MTTPKEKPESESISSNGSDSVSGVISVTRRRVMQVGLRALPVIAALGTGAGAFYNSISAHDRMDAVTPAITQSAAHSAQAAGVAIMSHEQLEADHRAFVERTNYQAQQGNVIHEAIFLRLERIEDTLDRLERRRYQRSRPERPAPLMTMEEKPRIPLPPAPPVLTPDAGPPKE